MSDPRERILLLLNKCAMEMHRHHHQHPHDHPHGLHGHHPHGDPRECMRGHGRGRHGEGLEGFPPEGRPDGRDERPHHHGPHHHKHHHHPAGHPGKMRLLGLLAQMDGSMQSEIAAEAGIRPASLSELIGRLEQTGMVERRQSEIDKRSVHIHLTEAGREAAREAGEMRSQLVDAAFAELDESECSVFADMLEKVLRGLERRNAKRDENLPEAGE